MDAKWTTVAQSLRDEITRGELVDELPSEADLMDRYEVSRTTIRRALAQLEGEGLVSGSQGSRRRVRRDNPWCWPMAEWERRHTAEADAWAETIREQGGVPSTDISVSIEVADKHTSEALGVDLGAKVVVRRRIRRVNGQAHQLADSFFPYELAEKHPVFLAPGDVSAPGGLLASVGLPQVKFRDFIEARMPTPSELRTLHMPPGTPLLVHRRTGYAKDGRPLRYMVTRMSANQVEMSYEVIA